MEAACGEYGDIVPKLVVAVKAKKCDQFQQPEKKINCDLALFKLSPNLLSKDDIDCSEKTFDSDYGSELSKMSDLKETAILDNGAIDDDGVDSKMSHCISSEALDSSKQVCPLAFKKLM